MELSHEGVINKGCKSLNEFLMEDYPKKSLVKRFALYKRLATSNFGENDEQELLDFVEDIKEQVMNHKIEMSILPIIEQKPCLLFTHLLEALSQMEISYLEKKIR